MQLGIGRRQAAQASLSYLDSRWAWGDPGVICGIVVFPAEAGFLRPASSREEWSNVGDSVRKGEDARGRMPVVFAM